MNPSDAKLLCDLNMLEMQRKRVIIYQQILLDRITRTKNEIYQRNNMVQPKAEIEKENMPPQSISGLNSIYLKSVTKIRAPLARFKQAQLIAERIKKNKWKMPPIRPDQCHKCRATIKDYHVCNIDNCFFGCACGFLARNINALNGHSCQCKKRNKDLAKYEAQLKDLDYFETEVKSEPKKEALNGV